MDAPMEDEKKPFDAEHALEEETMPDPDEVLMMDQGHGRVWMVKIPRHLMDRWSAVDAENVHLATIRVYHDAVSPSGRKPRIVLFLPPIGGPAASPHNQRSPKLPAFGDASAPVIVPLGTDEPEMYELEMLNERVENQLVVASRPKDPPADPSIPHNPRARASIVTGKVKHDCNLRPMLSAAYRRQIKERTRKANQPARTIMRIEDAGVKGGRGGINMLSSGVGMDSAPGGGAFGDLSKGKRKADKGAFERMARMPRNQLLDLLFSLFRETPRWGVRLLRERTQQPEAYLKEVLGDIAFLHRSGEFNGMWELKANFKEEGIKAENVPSQSGLGTADGGGDVKMEGMEHFDGDEDDEDDEDDDMEEVS